MKHIRTLDADAILELIFIYLTEASTLTKDTDIISVLADMGRTLTGSDRCTVWIVSDDKKSIWTTVAQGINAIEMPINVGIVGASITNQEKIIVEDAYSDKMGSINLEEIIFSPTIKSEWGDSELFEKLKRGESFLNPASV